MKVSDLRNMSVDELQKKDKDLIQELFNLRFQLHTGRLENTAKLSSLKKDIARVKTILQEMRG
ncbi:MAG: 50S ribosomal protein [Geobacteraceae bacterium]|nr:MAG: 50S ribosomal protein [Geobacteraceae bacterium]